VRKELFHVTTTGYMILNFYLMLLTISISSEYVTVGQEQIVS